MENFNGKKLYLTLVFASLLLSFTIFSTHEAFAHGAAPGTCPNRYDGPITAAKIVARGMVYDPIANPGLTFKLSNEEAYIVTFTIHTQAQSSQGNSDLGTTWYSQNTHGFFSGSCVDGAGPDQDVIVTAPVLHSGSSPPEFTQRVQFNTLISGFYYHVMWVNPDNTDPTPPSTNSVANLAVESADMSGMTFEGMWVELWRDGMIVQSGWTPFTALVQTETQYVVFIQNWEDIIFDHWEDGTTNQTRAITLTQDATLTAFFQTVTTPTNNPLVANDDFATTDEDVPITIDVMANDNFSGTGLFSVSSVTEPSNGIAVINSDNTVTYTSNANFFGSDFFLYTVSDPTGLVQDSATVFVTINPVNDPPVANDDFITTDEDTPVSFFAEENDFDVDGDEIFVISLTQGANGVTELSSNGAVAYTPNQNFNGQDSFTYVLSDINGATDTATVSVTIKTVNDTPVAIDDSAATERNTPVVIDVLTNDSDPDGDSLNITSTSTPSNGTATINANNTITYTSNQIFAGSDSFVYTISDGNGGTDSATVSVEVTMPQPTITTINVGSFPLGIVIDETKNIIYVANSQNSSISVVDGSTDTVVDTIQVPPFPHDIAFDASSGNLYVSQQTNSSISVIDPQTKTVTDTIAVSTSSRGLALDADNSKLYAAGGTIIHVINTTDNSVLKTVQVGTPSFDIALNSVTDKVYVGVSDSFRNHEVVVIDGNSDSVIARIQTPEGSNDVGVDELNNIVYVASGTNILYVIDGATNSISKILKTEGFSSSDVFVIPSLGKILVSDQGLDSVIIIDSSSHLMERNVMVGSNPVEIAVNTSTNKVYVTNHIDDTISVFDLVE